MLKGRVLLLLGVHAGYGQVPRRRCHMATVDHRVEQRLLVHNQVVRARVLFHEDGVVDHHSRIAVDKCL